MAEVASGRVSSLGRVSTGIGSVSRGAETKTQLAGYVLATLLAGYIGTIYNPSIEYSGFYVRNTEIFWCRSIVYGECNFYHSAMQNALYQPVNGKMVEETKQSQFFSFLHRTLQQSTATARAHNSKALDVENSTLQGRFFAKDIAKSLRVASQK